MRSQAGRSTGISPSDLLARIDGGRAPAILDVRSAREFAAGHVPTAAHVPFWAVVAGAAVPSAPEAEVVIYCGHGPRAYMAGAALRHRGYRRVVYLDGHMTRWQREGLREDR
jgi:rhodanese-related sulfurtransferase